MQVVTKNNLSDFTQKLLENDKTVKEDVLKTTNELTTNIKKYEVDKFSNMDCELKSVKIFIVKGSIVDNKPVVGDDQTGKIFDYTMIQGGLVYVFDYVFDAYFYDADKNFISKGTKLESQCILAPNNAVYMVAEYPSGRGVSGSKGWQIGVVRQTDYDTWDIGVRKTILETVIQCREDYTKVSTNRRRAMGTYFLGDSEASRGYGLFTDKFVTIPCLSSFGGHKSDFINSNIGITTNAKDNLTSLKNIKTLIISGTNDDDDNRLRGYMIDTLARLRDAGCQEVWGTGYFCGLNVTQDKYLASKKYLMQKAMFGGHFIDQINVAFGMGVYFNLYHPDLFVQPAIGSNTTITFEDVTAMTECGMITTGKDFYVQYYDDKYDIYTCVSVDETANTVTAKLKENNSGIAPGDNAGYYTEEVATGAWTGNKKTVGWVFAEEDKTAVGLGHLPYNIYQDHQVHFGKIFGRIIDSLLFTSGVIEIGEEGLTNERLLQ